MVHQGALHFHGAQPVPGDIHDVIHTAQQPEIAVLVPLATIPGKIDVLAEAPPIGLLISLRVSVDGARHGGPGGFEDQVAASAQGDAAAGLIHHIGLDARKGKGGRTRFGGGKPRQGGDHDGAGLGLPPGVYDGAAPLPDLLVVPHPGLGVDGLTHRPQQAQAGQVVLCRKGLAPLHDRPDGRGSRVEDIHAILGHHGPPAVLVRPVRRTLVEDPGGSVGQGAVNDIAVPGDPADVGRAPVDVLLLGIEDPLVSQGSPQQIACGGVQNALGLGRGARGVKNEQRVLRVHGLGLAVGRDIFDRPVPPDVPGLVHLHRSRLPDPSNHHHLLDTGAALQGLVDVSFERNDLTAAVAPVGGDHQLGLRVVDPVPQGFGAESPEDHAVGGADSGASQQGDGQFRDHGHVDGDPVTLPDPQPLHGIGEPVDLPVEVGIGQHPLLPGFSLPDEGGLVAPPAPNVPVQAVDGNVYLTAHKPLSNGWIPVQDPIPLPYPLQAFGGLGPVGFGILGCPLVNA